MSDALSRLRLDYRSAFVGYLSHRGEPQLTPRTRWPAGDRGRVGLLDLVQVHNSVTLDLLRAAGDDERLDVAEAAAAFLVEVLAPPTWRSAGSWNAPPTPQRHRLTTAGPRTAAATGRAPRRSERPPARRSERATGRGVRGQYDRKQMPGWYSRPHWVAAFLLSLATQSPPKATTRSSPPAPRERVGFELDGEGDDARPSGGTAVATE